MSSPQLQGAASQHPHDFDHPAQDRETGMRLLRWQSWCAIVAFLMTLVFVLFPGPYPMAVFTFIAQPLFGVAAVSYLIEVIRDLHRKEIL